MLEDRQHGVAIVLFPNSLNGVLGKKIEKKERSVTCACVLPLE